MNTTTRSAARHERITGGGGEERASCEHKLIEHCTVESRAVFDGIFNIFFSSLQVLAYTYYVFPHFVIYLSMANLLDFVVGAAVGTGGQKGILIRIECEFL